jgi:putative transposase
MLQRYQSSWERSQQFIDKAEILRRDHPEMGCRKMALILRQSGWGRDKTEALLMACGFRVIYPPNYTKTTHSVRLHQFGNLIEGLIIKNINKVVQTDITYLWVKDRFYYLVFIIDVYSRLIIGYHASCDLEAQANMKALQMMIKLRGEANMKGLIHHSDRGSQYSCNEYLGILKEHDIKISMCNEAWENAYTERINRTIKYEYLRHRNIDCLQTLRKEMDRAIKLYNTKRPHWSLPQQMAPAIFEDYVSNLSKARRPKMMIYKPVKVLSTK